MTVECDQKEMEIVVVVLVVFLLDEDYDFVTNELVP